MDLTNVPEHAKAGLMAMNADKALAQLESPTVILSRYETGETIEEIAADLGITAPSIYRYLWRNATEAWKEYQGADALHRHQQAEDELRTAQDGVTISRAREMARVQQWKLERVLRRIYGQDAPQVQINVNLGEIGSRIRDLEAELLGNAAVLRVDQPKE